jgi:hypothetical protein
MPPAVSLSLSLSLSLSVLHLYYFFVLIVLAVPFVLTVQHTTQTSMPRAGFEPAIPASDWPLGPACSTITQPKSKV